MNKIFSRILIAFFISCLLYAGYDSFFRELFSSKNNESQNFHDEMKKRSDYRGNKFPLINNSNTSSDESNNSQNSNSNNDGLSTNNESESLNLKVTEFIDSYNQMSSTYLDGKSKNWNNTDILYSLASEYKKYMSALSIQIKYFYETNSENLTNEQKNQLQGIFDKCDLAVQQATIDGAN